MKAKAASQHQYIIIQENQSQINENPFLYCIYPDMINWEALFPTPQLFRQFF